MAEIVENHLRLPPTCEICGKANQYWADSTFGCEEGHVIAYTNDGIIWWYGDKASQEKQSSGMDENGVS